VQTKGDVYVERDRKWEMDGRGSKFNIRNSGNRRVPFRYAGYFLSSVLILPRYSSCFLTLRFPGIDNNPGGVNTGLGYPKVSPSSPMRSTNFTISCPTISVATTA